MRDPSPRLTHNEGNKNGCGEGKENGDHARGSKNCGLFDENIGESVDERKEQGVDGATAGTTDLTTQGNQTATENDCDTDVLGEREDLIEENKPHHGCPDDAQAGKNRRERKLGMGMHFHEEIDGDELGDTHQKESAKADPSPDYVVVEKEKGEKNKHPKNFE